MVEFEEVLSASKSIVLLTIIAVLKILLTMLCSIYHEPYASSACEMVTEIPTVYSG